MAIRIRICTQSGELVLTGIHLQNYKRFRFPVDLELRPITLIYGPNSSGKSSLIKSIALIKQSLTNRSEVPLALTSPQGHDFGSFDELLTNGNIERTLRIGFSIRHDGIKTSLEGGTLQFDRPTRILLEIKSSDSGHYIKTLTVGLDGEDESFKLSRSDSQPIAGDLDESLSLTNTLVGRLDTLARHGQYLQFSSLRSESALVRHAYPSFVKTDLPTLMKRLRSIISGASELPDPDTQDFYGWFLKSDKYEKIHRGIAKIKGLEYRSGTLAKVHEILSKRLSQLETYDSEQFGREIAERSVNKGVFTVGLMPAAYARFAPQHRSSTLDDDSVFQILLLEDVPDPCRLVLRISEAVRATFDTVHYIGPLRQSPSRGYHFGGVVGKYVGLSGEHIADLFYSYPGLEKKVNELAALMGLGYKLRVARSTNAELQNAFDLRLIPSGSRKSVSLADVGFGVSQALPILAQGVLESGATIVIEQPEIHLHPRLQAAFGDVLARLISSPFKNRFVIETHSEHLLLRMQRRVRERKLDPKHLRVYYVAPDGEGSSVQELRVADDGSMLDLWPTGFFDETFEEMFS